MSRQDGSSVDTIYTLNTKFAAHDIKEDDMGKKALYFMMLILFWAMALFPCVAEEGFPLRAEFSKVKHISTEALAKDYKKVIIVDVRSKLEFDVIHINKALHIPVALATFGKELENVRSKNGTELIVFYCNGHKCKKAYEAAEQAMDLGFQNVYAYDAGIHDWTMAHPELATLLGKSPAAKEKLISSEMFAKKKIKYAEFKKKAEGQDAVVIDIREPFQRQEVPDIAKLRNIPSDRLVQLLAAREFKKKQLLITDAVGKQVEWLQYYLENYGYKNYYFLENGVLSAKDAGAVKESK